MAGHCCCISWCFNICNSIEKVFKPGECTLTAVTFSPKKHFHFLIKNSFHFKLNILSLSNKSSFTAPEKSLQYDFAFASWVWVQPSETRKEESGGGGEKSPKPSLHPDSQNGSGKICFNLRTGSTGKVTGKTVTVTQIARIEKFVTLFRNGWWDIFIQSAHFSF